MFFTGEDGQEVEVLTMAPGEIEPLFGELEWETVYLNLVADIVVDDLGEVAVSNVGTSLTPAAVDDPRPLAFVTESNEILWVYDKLHQRFYLIAHPEDQTADIWAYLQALVQQATTFGGRVIPMKELYV